MMSEVQFVLGAFLSLPRVDIVWILKHDVQLMNIMFYIYVYIYIL